MISWGQILSQTQQHRIVVAVVAVVLTLARIVKFVVTGQAPVTLELRNTPGKKHTTQGGTRTDYSYITADAIVVKSTHDAYENTWKCGELKLYFSSSAGGSKKKKKQLMPPPDTYKSEIGSQSAMCQVQAGAYVLLLTPGDTNYSDCHPRKTTTYILYVVSITTHTQDMRKSIGEKKRRKEKKIEELEKRRKTKQNKKASKEEEKKTRKARKNKSRKQGKKKRKRKKEK